jgi:hypothetical protein
MNRARKLMVALSCAGLLWSVAVGLLLWFLPLGSSASESSSGATAVGDGQSFASISALGPLPLIIPVALVAIGAWSALWHHKIVLIGATVLIALFAFLTGFSIGLFYLPAVALLVAVCFVALSASGSPPSVAAR